MTQPTALLSPLKAAVPTQGGAVDLLVRLQAPDAPTDQAVPHLPKRLSLVVDRSGSMRGKPLNEALHCVMHIAKHLTAQDQLSLVVYDDEVDVIVPLASVTSLTPIQAAVDVVSSGGSTNLFAGWQRGAQELEGGNSQSISRVLLLSDGQANQGETRVHKIERHCKAWFERGVSTTTVGLGRDFNEELMIAMAKAGGGQQYYGQTAEDLYDSFDQELALLQAMYWREIRAKLIPAPGVIVELLSDGVTQHADGSYAMNDLAWGAETWFAVRLHISPGAEGSLRDLLAVSFTGTNLQGQANSVSAPLLQLPTLSAQALDALPLDTLVQSRLLEAEFGKASEELRRLTQQGRHRDAQRKIDEMQARFGQHPWLMAKLTHIRRLADEDVMMMSKEVSYSAMRMSRSLASKNEVMFCMDETESAVPAFLRRKETEGRGRRSPRPQGSDAQR